MCRNIRTKFLSLTYMYTPIRFLGKRDSNKSVQVWWKDILRLIFVQIMFETRKRKTGFYVLRQRSFAFYPDSPLHISSQYNIQAHVHMHAHTHTRMHTHPHTCYLPLLSSLSFACMRCLVLFRNSKVTSVMVISKWRVDGTNHISLLEISIAFL